MTMAQRTSSAAELTKRPPAPEGFAEITKQTEWGTPVSLLEFAPAQEKIVGLFYLTNTKPTVQDPWVIYDGFYLSSHGDKVTIAVLVYKDLINGTWSEDKGTPSQITKSGYEVYFLNRAMAEYYAKNILNPFSNLLKAAAVKTYNNLVDQLEDRDQAGHFEDGLVLITDSVPAKTESGYPVLRGITEVLVNKKLHLVHVVASVGSVIQDLDSVVLKNRQDLIEPMYYTSDAVAGFGYNDRVNGAKPLASLRGCSYEEIIQHLARNSK